MRSPGATGTLGGQVVCLHSQVLMFFPFEFSLSGFGFVFPFPCYASLPSSLLFYPLNRNILEKTNQQNSSSLPLLMGRTCYLQMVLMGF